MRIFVVTGFIIHAYIYAKRRKNKKERRLAIEQERRQYNALFNVRRCALRGLDEIAFRRIRSQFTEKILPCEIPQLVIPDVDRNHIL